MSATRIPSARLLLGARARRPSLAGAAAAFRVERRKLSAQLAIRLALLAAALGPVAFAGILELQSGSPGDSLYGVWVHSSGFAVSLVVLGFAGSWGLPLLVGILAGDLFSSEDRHGTWKLVLTRSSSRGELFAGKVLAAGAGTLAVLGLAAASSLIAGLVFVGPHHLVSLSGTILSPGRCLWLVLVSWLLCALPALAFAAFALLLSVATRNGIVGVLAPAIAALVMQLLLLGGSGVWAHTLLISWAFDAWHGLFTARPFLGPVLASSAVSLAWIAVCLAIAWRIVRRRDFAGPPVSRRDGWRTPVQVAAAAVAVVALLVAAGNWGPAGITASRLKTSLIPAFERLTFLQQRELGRTIVPGTKLDIVLPSCSHRGSAPRGPGDWVCTINVLIPSSSGSLPPQPTPVTYDVSVASDGCFKAESPPAFVGQQLMRDSSGDEVVNPLYTIYGCFNVL